MSKMGPCDKCSATAEHRCICGSLAEGCQASSSLRLLRFIQNDRVCKNCKFWDAVPEWALNQGQGECLRIKYHWVKHYESDEPPLVSTAILSNMKSFLVTEGVFGCNMFEAGSIDDKKKNPAP